MKEKTFSCDQDGILGAQAFLESFCEEPKPAIVMDEIVSNIVRCSGAQSFTIGLDRLDADMTMVFTDSGRVFDPTTEVEMPDLSAKADDRDIGGLGIFMVKKMSKSVSYRRQDGKNILTVVM